MALLIDLDGDKCTLAVGPEDRHLEPNVVYALQNIPWFERRGEKYYFSWYDIMLAKANLDTLQFTTMLTQAAHEKLMQWHQHLYEHDSGIRFAGDDQLRPFQHRDVLYCRHRPSAWIGHEMGVGKAQPFTEPVLTPTGWRAIGSLAVGDEVCSPSGGVAKVNGVYPQGVLPVYKVVMADGGTTRCCLNHLWKVTTPVRQHRGEGWVIRSTEELLQSVSDAAGNSKYRVPLISPVAYGQVVLPLDPYVLGCLLGDGTMTTDRGSICLSTASEELLFRFRSKLPSGVELVHRSQYDYGIIKTNRSAPNPIHVALRGLGLMGKKSDDKFIPQSYLISSIDQRLELLRGLMDTDGYVSSSGITQFSSNSFALAHGVMSLVWSLGGNSKMSSKRTASNKNHYLVTINLDLEIVTVREKSSRRVKRSKYHPCRPIKSIEPDGEDQCVCISVDHPEHTYITRDYIITHNTYSALGVALDKFQRGVIDHVILVCPGGAKKKWARAVSKNLPAPFNSVVLVEGAATHQLWMQKASWHILTYAKARTEKDVLAEMFHQYGNFWEKSLLIGDELHRVQNEARYIKGKGRTKVKQTDALQQFARWSVGTIATTGQKITNLEKLFTMMDSIDPRFFRNWSEFSQRYLSYDVYIAGRIVGTMKQEELAKKLPMIKNAYTKADVFPDLDPVEFEDRWVELTDRELKLYRQYVKKGFFEQGTESKDRRGMAQNSLTINTAARRFLDCPALINETWPKQSSKMKELLMLLEGNNQKVAIFSQWKETCEMIVEQLGRENCDLYVGGAKDDLWVDYLRQNQKKYFVFNTKGKEAIDLHGIRHEDTGEWIYGASVLIMFDELADPGDNDQIIGRIHRFIDDEEIMSKWRATVIRLRCMKTVEEHIVELQNERRDFAEKLAKNQITFQELEKLMLGDE